MSLLEYDQALFEAINMGLANPVLDWLCKLLRNAYIWAPLYIFLGALLIVNFRRKGLYLILSAMLLAGITDYTTSSLIKPIVNRPRPCQDVSMAERVRPVVQCGAASGFPSTHAANHFGLATLLGFALHKRINGMATVLVIWAALICFSQVYVGVHYPLDVLFGGALGSALGWWMWMLYRRLFDELPLAETAIS